MTNHLIAYWKSCLLLAAMTLLTAGNASAQVDTLANIKQKGVLVVGVKADYKPYGYTDPSGQIIGFEVDLANDLAKRLGVKLELVPVVAANRMEFVKQGRTDLMIATMAYKPDRAEVVGIPEPYYYASAATVFAKKDSGLKAWADLKDKSICGIQGAYYNRRAGEEFGAKMLVFKGVPEVLSALQAGNCMGFVFDSTFFAGLESDPKWAGWGVMLPPIDPEPWGMAVKKEDTKIATFISETTKEWHKTGYLLDLEKKWNIAPAPFLAEQHQKFK